MRLLTALLLSLVTLLTGCAALNSVDSEVTVFSQWPAGRKPASYAFDRLPSQQARAPEQQQIESIARTALIAAGFTEASDPQGADVTVQLGLRLSRSVDPYYYDPYMWRGYWGPYWRGGVYGPYGRGYWGPGMGPYWGPYWGPGVWGAGYPYMYDAPRYDLEVALLFRDRKTSQPLYEVHASNDRLYTGSDRLTAAMFMAALKDFPYGGPNPRTVTIQLPAQ